MTASAPAEIVKSGASVPGAGEDLAEIIAAKSAENSLRRIGYLDALRGFASLQVLGSHVLLAFFVNIAVASPFSHTLVGYFGATPLFFLIDGASAVCIFFILSGYVLTRVFSNTHASVASIVGSRFLRLGLPALAACAFSAILFHLFGGYDQAAGVMAKSPWLAENWRPAPDLWFVKDALIDGVLLGYQDSSIFQWLGLPATDLEPMANSFVTPLWTLSLEFYGSLLILLLARTKSAGLAGVLAIFFFRSYLFCFVVGHVAARLDLGGRRIVASWPAAAALAATGVLVCVTSHFWTPHALDVVCVQSVQILPPCPLDKTSYLARIYGATLFTLGLMQCLPMRAFFNQERLRALGRLSFPIYLTHWPIIFGAGGFVLIKLAPAVGPLPARLMTAIVCVAVTIGASFCFVPIDQLALRASRAVRRSFRVSSTSSAHKRSAAQ